MAQTTWNGTLDDDFDDHDFDFPKVKPKRPSVTHHDGQKSVGHDVGSEDPEDVLTRDDDGYDDESGGDYYYY